MNKPKKRWVEVTVKQEHIDQGKFHDCYSCPVALALCEATGIVWNVMDTDARIEVLFGPHPIWKFPADVRIWVLKFDSHSAVTPITFRLPARFADTARWRNLGA